MINRSLQNLSNSIRIGCALIGLLATTALPMSAKCSDSQGNPGLDGHWVITIKPLSGHNFTTLLTFSPNGDVELFASNTKTQSIGRGTYCKSGNREFTVTIVLLDYEANDAGLETVLVTLHSTLQFQSEDQFSGPNNDEVVDAHTGQVLFSGNDGSVEGKRVKP
jgi:hypothetical protein